MASTDTNVDIIISSALLIASKFYQRSQVSVRKCKRMFWTAQWQNKKKSKNRWFLSRK